MNVNDRAFVHKLSKLIATILLSILSLFIFTFFTWSLFIRGPILIAFAAIMLLIFLPLKLDKLKFTLIKVALLIIALTLIIVFSARPMQEIQKQLNNWNYQLAHQGLRNFSTLDKIAIYNTNLVYGFYAQFIGAPEFGKETLRLCIPSSSSRSWHSSMAMKSPKITSTINNWLVLLSHQKRNVAQYNLPARKITWNDYSDDRRVALALNPVVLEGKALPEGNRWRLDCKASVYVRYRQDGVRLLFKSKDDKLINPGGPFWALQELGWLSPYTAVWTWSIYSDDPRLSSSKR
jgi:hypothetical protein